MYEEAKASLEACIELQNSDIFKVKIPQPLNNLGLVYLSTSLDYDGLDKALGYFMQAHEIKLKSEDYRKRD